MPSHQTDSLRIGLINNMPDAALDATERQFRRLLESAADGVSIRLSLFSLPEVPRSAEAVRRIANSYSPICDLWDNHLDGVIVTGAEPRVPDLRDEPYWKSLARVMEWAEQNTYSAVWSCLAAHAAVLHIDGIERKPLGRKLSGVFECARVAGDPLTPWFHARSWMPHSRWNGIPETALAACGYRILTRSEDAGIDAFVKQRKSLFLFFQGHPEYEADSLLLEYRRDVRRFLSGEKDCYPSLPHSCFDEATVALLTAARERALSGRRNEPFPDFPVARINTWRPAAIGVYRNWLRFLSTQKKETLRNQQRQQHYTRASAAAAGANGNNGRF
jgi:homoserine O-succinyltransferase